MAWCIQPIIKDMAEAYAEVNNNYLHYEIKSSSKDKYQAIYAKYGFTEKQLSGVDKDQSMFIYSNLILNDNNNVLKENAFR